jgi:hypothetical protein
MAKPILGLTKQNFNDFAKGEAVKITYAEFLLQMTKIRGGRFRSFLVGVEVDAKMNKGCIKRASKACPEGEYTNTFHKLCDKDVPSEQRIKKVSVFIANMNMNYEKQVNAKRAKFGLPTDFVAQENWHSKEIDKYNDAISINTNNDQGKKYLNFNPTQKTRIGFRHGKGGEWLNEVDEAMVKAHIVKSSAPTNQGLPIGEEIRFQTVTLTNILFIKFDGTLYQIVEADQI